MPNAGAGPYGLNNGYRLRLVLRSQAAGYLYWCTGTLVQRLFGAGGELDTLVSLMLILCFREIHSSLVISVVREDAH